MRWNGVVARSRPSGASRDDPSDLARNRFLERIYGAHPYHHPREGLPGTLARFTRGDLAGFYHRHYRPDGAVLALVGDLDPGEAFRLAADLFGGWGTADATTPAAAGAAGDLSGAPLPSSRAEIPRSWESPGHRSTVYRDGLARAVIRLGTPGIRRDAPVPRRGADELPPRRSGAGSRLPPGPRARTAASPTRSSPAFYPRRERGLLLRLVPHRRGDRRRSAPREVEGELAGCAAEGPRPPGSISPGVSSPEPAARSWDE